VRAGDRDKLSAQEICYEHSSPSGTAGTLVFHRSFTTGGDTDYTMYPGVSGLVVASELKLLPTGARSAADACFITYGQTGATFAVSSTADGTTTVTSSAGFAAVTTGMSVTGTGVSGGTTVTAKASTSSLTLSAVVTTGSPSLTFAPVQTARELRWLQLTLKRMPTYR
jgi:hypothetical protein